MQEETTKTGAVALRVYVYYFKYMATPLMLLLIAVLYTSTQPFRAAGDELFGEFATAGTLGVNKFIGIYAAVMAAHVICVLGRSMAWAKASVTTSDHCHDTAVSTLIRCPMSFFEST